MCADSGKMARVCCPRKKSKVPSGIGGVLPCFTAVTFVLAYGMVVSFKIHSKVQNFFHQDCSIPFLGHFGISPVKCLVLLSVLGVFRVQRSSAFQQELSSVGWTFCFIPD